MPTIKDKKGYLRPKNITDAVSRNQKTMLQVQKDGGLKNLVGWVKGRLIELFTYLGCFETVSEYQVQTLATRICTKYIHMTPSELDYFFVAFENGEYGKLYNGRNINPQEIMIGLSSYEVKLQEAREEKEARTKAVCIAKQKEESKKNAVTWEEYCKMKGIEGRENPLTRISTNKNLEQ